MGNLVNAAQAAYDAYKATNPSDIAGWDKLTDAEVAALFRNDQKYKQAITDAQAIETSFYEARTAAFSAFEATKQTELAALQTLWQSKEDNGFDVDYTGA